MSVYSGFCTRKQESDYNHCLYKMLFTLAKRCVKAIRNEAVDNNKFSACVGKLFGMIIKLEEQKYQAPKFSDSLLEIASVLGLKDNSDFELPRTDLYRKTKPKMQLRINPVHQKSRSSEMVQLPSSNRRTPQYHCSTPQQEYQTIQFRSESQPTRQLHLSQPVQINPMNYSKIVINNRLPPDDDIVDKVQTGNGNQNYGRKLKSLEEKEREFLAQFGK